METRGIHPNHFRSIMAIPPKSHPKEYWEVYCKTAKKNIFKHLNHSVARTGMTAWTPPSLPDSIVLLGGWNGFDAAFLDAEIVPGIDKEGGNSDSTYASFRRKNVRTGTPSLGGLWDR